MANPATGADAAKLDDLQVSIDTVTTSLSNLSAQMSKIASQVASLQPLVPLANRLRDLPEKVMKLEAAAFKYAQDIRALEAAVSRLERDQRGDKRPVDPGADGGKPEASASINPRHLGYHAHPTYDIDPRLAPLRRPPIYQMELDQDAAVDPRFHPRAKLEFPTYDGKDDPLPWLNCCESFFRGQYTPENRKLWYASLHLTGTAQRWYNRLELNTGTLSWCRFVQLVQSQFGPSMTESPLGELVSLRWTGSVDDYVDRFLSLACCNIDLSEPQQVQLFVAGLVNHLKTDVAMRQPPTLDDAIKLARAYEQRMLLAPTDLAPSCPSHAPPRPGSYAPSQSAPASESAASRPSSSTTSLPRKRLSPAEMAQRRAEGLCFNCDEKFSVGHRCKKLFIMEIAVDDDDSIDDGAPTTETTEPSISLHALTGVRALGANTFKVQATVGVTTVTPLLGSGSTHNFIDDKVAHRVGLAIHALHGLSVAIANGDRVQASGICPDQRVMVATEAFAIDLGVPWLASLGPALWDFGRHTLCFTRNGARVVWTGVDAPVPPTAAALDAGVDAVAVWPYRYAHIQKDELERQCDAMLQAGVIRPSASAFSSPALLIKKQDGSWRFYVDCRALNAKTIKDKFPIPVVEKLLDELRGAKFFTKLDMRSGYHQVRMHPDNVEKMAFRTHQGLFEFLVMPFGQTNAPATFQALMNDILLPYLRRFVLVFFDDILIYSSSWAEHLQHVRAVLQTLQEHQLLLKCSKCEFGLSSVAYLGHVISAAGVAMDQQKVQAVLDWPVPASVRALRALLGLAGYYRRFIKTFSDIAAPLMALLRKDGFKWGPVAETAFRALQRALTAAPVLQLPDFDCKFIVECDAFAASRSLHATPS
ncbi:hypothetical protein U9M48_004903 [Paspalum notatum var. saurae]|uniref:Reverse transcriptase domain-containing protein n=1 Tax=Paspalum notatum var. saurae TaxID=547442 RepID=A0AAQ3PNX9_PASNO